MKILDKNKENVKHKFSLDLQDFVIKLRNYVSETDGDWTVKGFIDIYKNIYTISSDTKIVSKILEIHLFPKILEFAEKYKYKIVLATHQNWYPDLSFISKENPEIKFAVDFKTTYRDPDFPHHVNGFTLGSHGAYFRNRNSAKNIQFPYSEYTGHFCLGIIYTRAEGINIDETAVIHVKELIDSNNKKTKIGARKITTVDNLQSITSVITDIQFFVREKWQIASDRQGSGNTANIGSITNIQDIMEGNGIFSKLGEQWFDEYWMNFGLTTMLKNDKTILIKRLEDFMDFKGGDKSKIVPIKSKKRVLNENNSTPD